MKGLRFQKFKSLSLAGILLAATMLTACSSDNNLVEEIPPVQQPSQSGSEQVYTVTVNATKGGETRALSVDGSDISATWSVGDEVTVYNVTKSADLSGTLVAQSTGDATVLKGDLTGTINNGDVLKLKYLSPSYDTQDGTLEYIAAHCDYAEADVTVSAVSGSSIATTDAAFANKQAILKFTLKNKANDAALSASELTVNASATTCTVTPASATSELYVAIPAISSKTVGLVATVGDDTYIYYKDGITFEAGKYYPIVVKMTEYDVNGTPLTFEAKTAGAEVTFNAASEGVDITPIEYSTDGITWDTYSNSMPIFLANVGDKVSFRGTNATYANMQPYNEFNSIFSCSESGCYIYGNIMSLVDKSDYATNTTLTAPDTFYSMFSGNTNIFNHPAKKLVLPATTLTENCYNGMFSYCTNLTIAPELPATILDNYCYQGMFRDCTGLTTAPELPATTLTGYCYDSMFYGCTSLTKAPKLPATTLTGYCYEAMFYGCTSLTKAPKLPATTLAEYCYTYMFNECTSLTEAPALPATTLASYCYYGMFYGCTGLTTAPELPAPTLADNCYTVMFRGCSKLNSIKCLATDISAYRCTASWVDGVAATGMFIKASDGVWTGVGRYDGIPSGWTVLEE